MDARPGISPELRRLLFIMFAVALLAGALLFGYFEWSRIAQIKGIGGGGSFGGAGAGAIW